MLDHVFTDAIGALRDAFADARLERLAFEERFQTDLLLGDVTWETSYGLPGESLPARVQAEVTCVWPTWSQTAYRNWYIDDYTEPSWILIAIVLRVQGLAEMPAAAPMLEALPALSPPIGAEPLVRTGPTVESIYGADLDDIRYAAEVGYEGTYELDEAGLADGSALDRHFNALGGWIASLLVKLGDMDLRGRA